MDIGTVPLPTLRSRMSIIPQDPVLFSGTLRRNLDPFNQHTDEQCWLALQQVDLKRYCESSGLAMPVRDGGSNFSSGQRQVVFIDRRTRHTQRHTVGGTQALIVCG